MRALKFILAISICLAYIAPATSNTISTKPPAIVITQLPQEEEETYWALCNLSLNLAGQTFEESSEKEQRDVAQHIIRLARDSKTALIVSIYRRNIAMQRKPYDHALAWSYAIENAEKELKKAKSAFAAHLEKEIASETAESQKKIFDAVMGISVTCLGNVKDIENYAKIYEENYASKLR